MDETLEHIMGDDWCKMNNKSVMWDNLIEDSKSC